MAQCSSSKEARGCDCDEGAENMLSCIDDNSTTTASHAQPVRRGSHSQPVWAAARQRRMTPKSFDIDCSKIPQPVLDPNQSSADVAPMTPDSQTSPRMLLRLPSKEQSLSDVNLTKVSSQNAVLRRHLDSMFERLTLSRIFLEWRRVAQAEHHEGQLEVTKEELATLCDAFIEVIRDVADLGSTIDQIVNPKDATVRPLEEWLTSLSEQQELEAGELGYELPWLQQHCREWKERVTHLKCDYGGIPFENCDGQLELPRLVRGKERQARDSVLLQVIGRIVANKCECSA